MQHGLRYGMSLRNLSLCPLYSFQLQARLQADSVNASEVGNGLLAALVAITAGCPFVGYWGACLIGGMNMWALH